jgi:hypothetical protein
MRLNMLLRASAEELSLNVCCVIYVLRNIAVVFFLCLNRGFTLKPRPRCVCMSIAKCRLAFLATKTVAFYMQNEVELNMSNFGAMSTVYVYYKSPCIRQCMHGLT